MMQTKGRANPKIERKSCKGGCKKMDWKQFIKNQIQEIRKAVNPQESAVVALSGGVDSGATAVLAHRAIGEQVRAVFIDTGLMREGEPQWVVNTFKPLGIKVEIVNAADRFFENLQILSLYEYNPEKMRSFFSTTFYEALGEVGADCDFLLQGTNRADIEETRGGIKLQHNVDIDPKEYGFKEIIEPLSDLYKNQIRELAQELGLPEEITQRQPFPGPGLACRCYPPITPERIEIVRQATNIAETIIENNYSESFRPFQYFAVLMGDKACGIKDGKRLWGDIIIVRAVESKDALFAESAHLSFLLKRAICRRITQEIPSVTRVLYDLSDKQGLDGPATIEFL